MASTDALQTKIDALYNTWQNLSLNSPDEAFHNFALHFNPNATAWLLSMRELSEPSVGRLNIIEGVKKAIQDSQVVERNIVARSTVPNGRKVFLESSSTIKVHGKTLENFPETTVVEFDDEGLVTDFKIYSCRSPIVAVIQEVTGEGPYERHEHCA